MTIAFPAFFFGDHETQQTILGNNSRIIQLYEHHRQNTLATYTLLYVLFCVLVDLNPTYIGKYSAAYGVTTSP